MTPEELTELRNNHTSQLGHACYSFGQAWPCPTVNLIDENKRLQSAVKYALLHSTERHTNTHTNCTHVSCHLRRALEGTK